MPTLTKKATPRKAKRRTTAKRGKTAKKRQSFDRCKNFNGQFYTGVQIGRGHHWHYDEGDWKETKITPDLWEISYAVTKRRVGHAPEFSGVPVGTEYHWYILAHQSATKLDANDYDTKMTGLKFKIAHRRADKGKWSETGPTQRKHLIAFLKEYVEQLEKAPLELAFTYQGTEYKAEGVPVSQTCKKGFCYEHHTQRRADRDHPLWWQRLENGPGQGSRACRLYRRANHAWVRVNGADRCDRFPSGKHYLCWRFAARNVICICLKKDV